MQLRTNVTLSRAPTHRTAPASACTHGTARHGAALWRGGRDQGAATATARRVRTPEQAPVWSVPVRAPPARPRARAKRGRRGGNKRGLREREASAGRANKPVCPCPYPYLRVKHMAPPVLSSPPLGWPHRPLLPPLLWILAVMETDATRRQKEEEKVHRKVKRTARRTYIHEFVGAKMTTWYTL